MSFRNAGFLMFAFTASTEGFLANEMLASNFGKVSFPATRAKSIGFPAASK